MFSPPSTDDGKFRHITWNLNAALIEQRGDPIGVRRLALNASCDPNPMLNCVGDVLIDRDAIRSITFADRSSINASTTRRYFLALATCAANLRSVTVSLDYRYFSAANSTHLDGVADFLQRLPHLHRLKLGRSTGLPLACLLHFSTTLSKCAALKHLHITSAKWLDGVLQPSAIVLLGRLRSVVIADSVLFANSTPFSAGVREKLKRMIEALSADAFITIDFDREANSRFTRLTAPSAIEVLLRALLQLSRELQRTVKLVDLDVSKNGLRMAIESLSAGAFVGRKAVVENSPRCWTLSDAQATIVFTGLYD